jgi:D-arabinose 1-dehydrogenase-like Zn-dependent alcohol dehydrogenase
MDKTKNILLRMVAVFAASSLSVVGASAVAGVEPAKAILIAGIGGVAVVIEGLARAFLKDGKLDDAEVNDIFTQVDKSLDKK